MSRSDGIFGGPLDEARAHAYWDAMSASYAPSASVGFVRFSHHRQHDAALRLAPVQRGAHVLDAGAGTGLLTRRLVAAGCHVTALDASAVMLDHLRPITCAVILSRIEDFATSERFDTVMAIGVLNFVTRPEEVLARLCGVVRPGGALVLQVTELSLLGRLYWLNYRVRGFRPFLFSQRWLVDRAREHGFEIIGSEHPLPHDLAIAFRRLRD